MNEKTINRLFGEALLRIRRDATNLYNLGIAFQPKIEFADTMIIYIPENKAWKLISDFKAEEKWNPTISEMAEFISQFDEELVKRGIIDFDNSVNLQYSNMNAKSLEPKFLQIMHLLKFEENKDCVIDFGNFLIKYNGYEIVEQHKAVEREVTDNVLKELLFNLSYNIVKNGLNECYSKLNRKK